MCPTPATETVKVSPNLKIVGIILPCGDVRVFVEALYIPNHLLYPFALIQAVLTICEELSDNDGDGTVGIPVKVGLAIGAGVNPNAFCFDAANPLYKEFTALSPVLVPLVLANLVELVLSNDILSVLAKTCVLLVIVL